MNPSAEMDPRLLELLVDHAVEGLDLAEKAELDALLGVDPDGLSESMDRTAAAVDLAFRGLAHEPLPTALAGKLLEEAASFTRAAAAPPQAGGRIAGRIEPRPQGSPLPWLVAAAAVLLAVAGWLPRMLDQAPDLGAQRQELMASAGDLVRAEWTNPTDHPAGAGLTGEVVWSNARQAGFMRFRGLASNDAAQQQYQLWIFDREGDDATPVDGGVFNIPAGADEVIVPIDARVPVAAAKMFAVTLERPGGVVVSKRDDLPALAVVPD